MRKEEKEHRLIRISFENFHQNTKADFRIRATPDREPDFVSGSGSAYWDVGEGVVRCSDHWVGVNGCERQASCVWRIIGDGDLWGWNTGYCAYEAFRIKTWGEREHLVTSRDVEIAKQIRAGSGVLTQFSAFSGLVPVWATLHFPGGANANAETEAVFRREPKAVRAITAPAPILDAILSGEASVRYGRVFA